MTGRHRPPIAPAQEMRDLLDDLGWTNSETATKLGVHVNTVSRWINRHCRIPVSSMVVLRDMAHRAKRRVPAAEERV